MSHDISAVAAKGKLLFEMHARVCKVLASAKRLEVIHLLRDGEKTAGDLVTDMGISKANVSQQLAVMREKGILASRREGRRIYYRLAYPGMLKAYDLLRQVLLAQLEDQGILAKRWRGAGRKP
jgi:ArsR family transcriptional regulator